jgi:electron transfer flavoprotein alpha/beta subunit
MQQLQLPCPALITICEYAYSLRLPGILGMRKAKGKSIRILRFSDLMIAEDACGLKGSLTKVIHMDTKFPGLRKGPKEADCPAAIDSVLSFIREASR